MTFRFTVDNHKSSKCGKKCRNYENIQDTAVSAAHRERQDRNDESSARNRKVTTTKVLVEMTLRDWLEFTKFFQKLETVKAITKIW